MHSGSTRAKARLRPTIVVPQIGSRSANDLQHPFFSAENQSSRDRRRTREPPSARSPESVAPNEQSFDRMGRTRASIQMSRASTEWRER